MKIDSRVYVLVREDGSFLYRRSHGIYAYRFLGDAKGVLTQLRRYKPSARKCSVVEFNASQIYEPAKFVPVEK